MCLWQFFLSRAPGPCKNHHLQRPPLPFQEIFQNVDNFFVLYHAISVQNFGHVRAKHFIFVFGGYDVLPKQASAFALFPSSMPHCTLLVHCGSPSPRQDNSYYELNGGAIWIFPTHFSPVRALFLKRRNYLREESVFELKAPFKRFNGSLTYGLTQTQTS